VQAGEGIAELAEMVVRGVYPRGLLVALALVIAGAVARTDCASANVRTAAIQRAASEKALPKPQPVWTRSLPLPQDRTDLVAFDTAPFPYNGAVPRIDRPFLDVIEEDGRRGHTTPRGRTLWEDATFSDSRVLLHIPKGFDVRRPGLIIVFFHGHRATLERDVRDRQQVPEQISKSGLNAVLVAPQFAFDASDSSAGRFWEPGGFGRFLGEAAQHLAELHGDRRSVRAFASMPVVIVAYSGGYLPTAWTLSRGGLKKRLRGVVLFDALYGELDTYAKWITEDRSAFFVSSFTPYTRNRNHELQRVLEERGIAHTTALPQPLQPGSVAFLATSEDANHHDYLTYAWVESPIQDVLTRIRGFRR
jgi:hypothetical protein